MGGRANLGGLTVAEQVELLDRVRRLETMLFKLIEHHGLDPRHMTDKSKRKIYDSEHNSGT